MLFRKYEQRIWCQKHVKKVWIKAKEFRKVYRISMWHHSGRFYNQQINWWQVRVSGLGIIGPSTKGLVFPSKDGLWLITNSIRESLIVSEKKSSQRTLVVNIYCAKKLCKYSISVGKSQCVKTKDGNYWLKWSLSPQTTQHEKPTCHNDQYS